MQPSKYGERRGGRGGGGEGGRERKSERERANTLEMDGKRERAEVWEGE